MPASVSVTAICHCSEIAQTHTWGFVSLLNKSQDAVTKHENFLFLITVTNQQLFVYLIHCLLSRTVPSGVCK